MRSHPSRSAGRVDLSFGDQAFGLCTAGLFGMIPFAAWCITLGTALGRLLGGDATSANPVVATIANVAAGVGGLALVALPCVVPWLVLRARQPQGARIEWSPQSIVEWDGPSRRAVIAWRDARVTRRAWGEQSTRRRGDAAVQIVDGATGATIFAWTTQPEGVGPVRRRLCAKDLHALLAAIDEREVSPGEPADWSRAADSDRRAPRWLRVVGRLGYPPAVIAPLLRESPPLGLALGAVAAALLALRAIPVLRELRLVSARLAEPPSPGALDPDRRADRLRLRAIRWEAAARVGFVVATIASTVVGDLFAP